MKRQKICIIGGGLTGLVTAITLSKLNCEIDLVTGNLANNLKSNRTIGISQNNYNFLKKLDIFEYSRKEIWPCSVMKLYTEVENEKFSKIFELNNDKKQKKILYMLENSKIIKGMMNKITKIKSIKIIKNKKISEIKNSGLLKSVKYNNNYFKYNLIIICAGYNSRLVKNLFKNENIENSYKETSVTTILKHNHLKNNIVRQFFLDNGILALLPMSNTKTSIVWSVEKDTKRDDLFFKKRIKFYTRNYFKNLTFVGNIEYKDLNFFIRNKYYLNRILLFGDALHVVHPFVGQGFNMIIRDLIFLERILREKIDLGLDIGSSDVLAEFSNETKPRNFSFSIGSDLLKSALSFKKARNDIFKILNKSNFAKDIVFDVANKGFRF